MIVKMITKLWIRMDEQSEYINRDRKYKYQTEVIIELKNELEMYNSRLEEVEEWISELKGKTMDSPREAKWNKVF